MGEVYEAEDLTLGGEVAIKTIRPEIASDWQSLVRFRREIHAGRLVTHPNVCRIFDVASTSAGSSEITYLTMEMLHGETVRAFIDRDAPIPPDRALPLFCQIASALDAAHRAGIVHSDLKPSNVMLVKEKPAIGTDESGDQPLVRVVVTDFGLSRFRTPDNQDGKSTLSETLLGTPDYMAPEQLDGGKISPATDVFAFGLVIYQVLTHAFPFKRVTAFSEARARFSAGAPPPDLTHSLPTAWQNFVLKCIQRNPDHRFQTGAELLAALSDINSECTTASATQDDGMPRRNPAWKRVYKNRTAAVVLLSLLIAVIILPSGVMRQFIPGTSQTIAVLPFENLTGDSQMAYLSQGITETLIQDLSRIPPHSVLSHAAVERYEKHPADPIEAGRSLHVDRVLSGSVSKLDDELFIQAELTDINSGKRVWSHSYRKKMASLSATLQEFSTEVTDELRLHLSGPLKERLRRQYVVGSESYRDYLKARFEMSKRTPEGLSNALRLFADVIGRDPTYAPAWAGQARAYNLMAFFGARGGGQEPLEALRKSQAAAVHALDLDSTLAEAWSSLAYVQMQADYQWSEAEKNFHRALELDPNWPDAHENYAYELTALGRFDEAIREIKMAETLAPDSPVFSGARAVFLHHARRYDEALQVLLPLQDRFMDRGSLAYFIAREYWAQSKNSEALALLEAVPLSGSRDIRTPLYIAALAFAGDTAKARNLRSEYIPQTGNTSWYYLALADLALDRKKDSLDDLENAWQQRAEAVMLLGVDPLLDPLRGEDRFKWLLKEIRLPNAVAAH
jgi:serine/threonine protein kinase/tetratricopeptide (TPR) repeat protein